MQNDPLQNQEYLNQYYYSYFFVHCLNQIILYFYNLQNKSAHICTMFVAERFFPYKLTLPWSHPVSCRYLYPCIPSKKLHFSRIWYYIQLLHQNRQKINLLYDYILLSSSKSTYKWENSL